MTTPAHVVGTVADQRPEPGPFPDLYITTSWEWSINFATRKPEWRPVKSMFHRPLAEIEAEAAELIATGHRNVRIIRIPGDTT